MKKKSENLPGICSLRTAFARRSANYPFQLKQTIYHKQQIVGTAHSFRVNATDICLVSTREALRHENFPYRQPANHLKYGHMQHVNVWVHEIQSIVLLPVGQYPNENI